jgi:alpha-galactosidase
MNTPHDSAFSRAPDTGVAHPVKKTPHRFRTIRGCVLALGAIAALSPVLRAADNGLGQKPLMGWSSWSTMGKSVSETKIKAQADALLAQIPGQPAGTTLKSLGYVYVNIDSGWRDFNNQCDGNGYYRYDRTKFPNGIRVVADYVHSKGLKLGFYMIPGMPKPAYDGNFPVLGTSVRTQSITDPTTNGNTENTSGASYAYRIDFTKSGANEYIQGYANLLASWGIDYIKFDFVGPGGGNIPADSREEMRHWLTATKNLPAGSAPIWIELSNSLKFANVNDWVQIANGWRIDGDIESGGGAGWTNVAKRFNDFPQWAPFSKPGGWGDFDSLPVGDGGATLSDEECRTTVTLWSIGCSPLIIGRDLTRLNAVEGGLLANREAIAINQAGRPATPISQSTSQQVWRVKNADGSYTVALFNLGSATATVTATWSSVGFTGSAAVRDLWSHTELGTFATGFSASVPSHGCRLLKATPGTSTPQAATPTFNPAGGSFTTPQSVAISTTTGGASIHYTTDGSTPTSTHGTVYTGPITVSTTTTVNAIAQASGFTDSGVGIATYTFGGGATLNFEAESLAFTPTGAVASLQTDVNTSGGQWVQLAGDAVGDFIDFTLPNVPAGTYQVKLQWKGNNNRGILNLRVDGTLLGSTVDQYSAGQTYPVPTVFGSVTFGSSGSHVIRLSVAGKNTASSSFVLSADKFILQAP